MFISIIIPPARKMKSIAIVILISVAISCLFYWTPVLNQLSNGWVIIICAVVASAFGAWKFPIKGGTRNRELHLCSSQYFNYGFGNVSAKNVTTGSFRKPLKINL